MEPSMPPLTFGTWTPIDAVKLSNGDYDVAWHDPVSGLYTVWSVDANGNYCRT
jgi:serralysin